MDRVRLGRALGVGTRQAARNLMEIADAAISPDPAGNARPTQEFRQSQTPQRSVQNTAPIARGVAEGGRRFTETFFGKLKRLGGALWLEFTGVFFGIFAMVGVQGAWKMRNALHQGASLEERQKFFLAVGVTLLFGYFCISGFMRARRRERGHTKRR